VTYLRTAARRLSRRLARLAGRRGARVALAIAQRCGATGTTVRVLQEEAGRRLHLGQSGRAWDLLVVMARCREVPVHSALAGGSLLRRTGNPALAATTCLEVCRRCQLTDAERALALTELGLAYEATGDLDGAAEQLAAAVDSASDAGEPPSILARRYYRLGRVQQRLERWDEAVGAYRAALAYDETRGYWWYRLGRVLERVGRWEHAATAYDRAVALDGDAAQSARRLLRARRRAPHWIFYTPNDPLAARSLQALHKGSEVGVVAPIAAPTLIGWVAPGSRPEDARVTITLNGTVVAEGLGVREVVLPGQVRLLEFRRSLAAVYEYAGFGDVLEVRCRNRSLTFVDGLSDRYIFDNGPSRANDLIGRLADAYVINKYGHLQLSLSGDRSWQVTTFQLFVSLRAEIEATFGLTLMPFYGTMLGAVREQDFIRQDNDFDTLYISGHSSPESVLDEFGRLCSHLIRSGYSLTVTATHTRVARPHDERKLDIFFGWFDSDDRFHVSFGYRGEPVRKTIDFFTFRSVRLGFLEVPVPVNAEEILEQCYGSGWRTPDPGFKKLAPERILPPGYQLDDAEVARLNEKAQRHHGPRPAVEFDVEDGYDEANVPEPATDPQDDPAAENAATVD
jgi:tetratricopeptide (TPR) repeat protein